jgi:hypothetical protein
MTGNGNNTEQDYKKDDFLKLLILIFIKGAKEGYTGKLISRALTNAVLKKIDKDPENQELYVDCLKTFIAMLDNVVDKEKSE